MRMKTSKQNLFRVLTTIKIKITLVTIAKTGIQINEIHHVVGIIGIEMVITQHLAMIIYQIMVVSTLHPKEDGKETIITNQHVEGFLLQRN